MSWPILSVVTFLPVVGALFIMLVRGSDRLYFVISLTSPGAQTPPNAAGGAGAGGPETDQPEDPGERQAVETFQAVLDTVELLDQRPIRRDQDDRMYASLAFYVGLGAAGKLENTLVPKQWFRVRYLWRDA